MGKSTMMVRYPVPSAWRQRLTICYLDMTFAEFVKVSYFLDETVFVPSLFTVVLDDVVKIIGFGSVYDWLYIMPTQF